MIDSAGESNVKADHSVIQVGEDGERSEREISHVGNQSWSRNEQIEDKLASLIEAKLPQESTKAVHTCVFRVPTKHFRENENAFLPQVVSIGPYHHRKERFQAMGQTKLRYLRSLLNRKPTRDTCLGKFVEEIRSREVFFRNCYDDKFDLLSSDEFVEMMVVDGCYILELIRRPSFRVPGWFSTIKNDLLLLENQIPWEVLDCLFNLTKTSQEVSLYLLTRGISGMKHHPLEKCVMRNLLDAVRNSLVGSLLNTRSYDVDWTPIPSVTLLEEIGVKFQSASNERDLSDITFNLKNGVMEIPYVMIRSNTESLFRNLIAYEQCLDNFDKCAILSYAMLLNQLIKSTKDLDSLIQKRIIDTELSEEDTVCFFNRLCYSTERINFFYSSLAQQLNDYYHRRWLRRWFARIKTDYLYNPKSILSLFSNAVILALILTAVQTLYGILAYYKPK